MSVDQLCLSLLLLCGVVLCDEGFVGSKSYTNRRLLSEGGESASDIFNKTLASSSKEGSSKFVRRTPVVTPATSRVMPSYSPPNRGFFTPPLPPEYLHPFADKPTLRGSNSDSIGGGTGARRPLPPPPPPFKLSPEELIPIRPPDLPPPHHGSDSKKKTLNTPSFKKAAAAVEPPFETSSTTTSNSRASNDTFEFVQILPYPSVSRILSGGSGRKHDVLQDILERTRLDKEPRTVKQEIAKALGDGEDRSPPPLARPAVPPPQGVGSGIGVDDEEDEEEEEEDRMDQEEEISPSVGGRHHTVPEEAQKQEVVVVEKNPERDLTGGSGDSDHESRTRQVLGIAWDIHIYLISTLFAILAVCSLINILRLSYRKHLLSHGYFLSLHGILLTIGCMRSFFLVYDAYNVGKSLPEGVAAVLLNVVFPLLTSAFAILFVFLLTAAEGKAGGGSKGRRAALLALFVAVHVGLSAAVHLVGGSPYLPLICQCVFIVMSVGLGLAYLYVYRSLSACTRWDTEKWAVGHAVRVTLATAMLSLLMAVVHVYGLLGVYGDTWLWWGYQLSVRVIEVSMCGLLAWAGVQRAPRGPPSSPDGDPPPHSYPAKLYDDTVFPLNSLARPPSRGVTPRSLQPSPSMLVAENGFVRFRTLADPDPYPSTHTYS